MLRALALLVLTQVVLSGCGAPPPPKHPLLQSRQQSCDDGGDGGVMIDGVCL